MVKNRNVIVFFLCIFTLIGGTLFILTKIKGHGKNSIQIRTDKEAIMSRFPKLGNFEKCYWKADIINSEGNDRVSGPTPYWMKGFVQIENEKVYEFIDKYQMEKIEGGLEFDFLPQNFRGNESIWYYSEQFNNYIKPPSFFGKFYLDSANKVIYFDVKK